MKFRHARAEAPMTGAEKNITSVLHRLRQVHDNVVGPSLTVIDDKLSIQTRLQLAFALKLPTPQESMIYEVLMTHALKAEKACPGGFDGLITLLLETFDPREVETTIFRLKALLASLDGSGDRLATRSDVDSTVSEIDDSVVRSMLFHAVELSGLGGKISVEKTPSATASVEAIHGYQFGIKPVFALTNISLVDARIACIDGFIESVSEIHQLLETIVDSRSSLLLCVRGLADDVINTLRVNHDRGVLKTIPIIVEFGLEGINTLNDIAVVSGTDVVSSLKGQLISTLRATDLRIVPKVSLTSSKLTITNPSSRPSVINHVNVLRQRRSDCTDVDVARLFDLRIKSLMHQQVVVRLPDNEFYVIRAQALDQCLRKLRSIVDHGVTSSGECAALKPSVTYYSIKCCEALGSLGAIVTS